jgi:hypothetical protein
VIISVLFAFNACISTTRGHVTEIRITNESSYDLKFRIFRLNYGFEPCILMQGDTASFLDMTDGIYGSHLNPVRYWSNILFLDLSGNEIKEFEITEDFFTLIEILEINVYNRDVEHAIYLLEITDELLGISNEG